MIDYVNFQRVALTFWLGCVCCILQTVIIYSTFLLLIFSDVCMQTYIHDIVANPYKQYYCSSRCKKDLRACLSPHDYVYHAEDNCSGAH